MTDSNLFNYRVPVIYLIAVIQESTGYLFSHRSASYQTVLSECTNTSKWKCTCAALIYASILCLCLNPERYLFGLEPWWDPCVLLWSAAGVVVGDGVSLEVWYQLRHHLFQLARHRAHGMLLSHTLAVHTDLPVETRIASGFTSGDVFTDLHQKPMLLKCQIFLYTSIQ